jgi:hypothetical protein
MSQWTNIVGTISINYEAQNTWDPETNGYPLSYNPKEKIKLLKEWFIGDKKKLVPSGTEGPFSVSITNAIRGPAIRILGSLRGFDTNKVPSILTWLNNATKKINKYNKSIKNVDDYLRIQDAVIKVTVEGKEEYLILFLKEKFSSFSINLFE